MAPQDIHGTCKYITLQSKRDLQVWLRLLTLREMILSCLGGPNPITWALKEGEPFPTVIRKPKRWQHKKEGLNLLLLSLKMEGGSHKQRMWSASRSCKKQGNGFSLRDSRKNLSLDNTLISAQWELCQSFDPNNCKINLYYLSH